MFYGRLFLRPLCWRFYLRRWPSWLAPKIGAMDIPKDERRVHCKPIPRFGGMAMFIGIMAATLIFIMPAFIPDKNIGGILIGGALIYLFGVIDDLRDISPKFKFLGQFICACIVYASGIRLEFVSRFLEGSDIVMSNVATFILIDFLDCGDYKRHQSGRRPGRTCRRNYGDCVPLYRVCRLYTRTLCGGYRHAYHCRRRVGISPI